MSTLDGLLVGASTIAANDLVLGKAGDRWCICAERWKEAWEAGAAPKVVLEATHMSMLEFVSLEELKEHAVDAV